MLPQYRQFSGGYGPAFRFEAEEIQARSQRAGVQFENAALKQLVPYQPALPVVHLQGALVRCVRADPGPDPGPAAAAGGRCPAPRLAPARRAAELAERKVVQDRKQPRARIAFASNLSFALQAAASANAPTQSA